jgi:heat shock protein HtpX
MAIITLLSAIPMIAYYMYMSSLYSRGYSSSGNRNTIGASMVGIVALVIYGITNLLVMYGSRIREYYADKGSVEIGNEPHQLASALYKLTYGTAKTPNQEVQRVEGIKAFFLNDPTKAKGDFNELTEVDSNMSGTIDRHELESVRQGGVRVGASASIMELMSTHPNMLKRIKHLSELSR